MSRWLRGVTQTICDGQIDGVYGNCLQAVVASYFDLPIEAVPHFAHFNDHWVHALSLWCKSTHRGIVERLGLARITKESTVVLLGTSPRDVDHCVLRVEGLIWDPHPSRAGLTEVTGALFFTASPAWDVADAGDFDRCPR